MSTHLPDDVHEALERFIAQRYPGLNQTEAIGLILRQWFVREGLLPATPEHGLPPDELNAANDD